MNRSNRPNTYARTGAWLGRACRKLLRFERQAVQGLIGQGCPSVIAYTLMWLIRLVVVGLALYAWMVVAILIVAALLVSKLIVHADLFKGYEEPEWRYGLFGFGQYDREGSRVDPHDPNHPDR